MQRKQPSHYHTSTAAYHKAYYTRACRTTETASGSATRPTHPPGALSAAAAAPHAFSDRLPGWSHRPGAIPLEPGVTYYLYANVSGSSPFDAARAGECPPFRILANTSADALRGEKRNHMDIMPFIIGSGPHGSAAGASGHSGAATAPAAYDLSQLAGVIGGGGTVAPGGRPADAQLLVPAPDDTHSGKHYVDIEELLEEDRTDDARQFGHGRQGLFASLRQPKKKRRTHPGATPVARATTPAHPPALPAPWQPRGSIVGASAASAAAAQLPQWRPHYERGCYPRPKHEVLASLPPPPSLLPQASIALEIAPEIPPEIALENPDGDGLLRGSDDDVDDHDADDFLIYSGDDLQICSDDDLQICSDDDYVDVNTDSFLLSVLRVDEDGEAGH